MEWDFRHLYVIPNIAKGSHPRPKFGFRCHQQPARSHSSRTRSSDRSVVLRNLTSWSAARLDAVPRPYHLTLSAVAPICSSRELERDRSAVVYYPLFRCIAKLSKSQLMGMFSEHNARNEEWIVFSKSDMCSSYMEFLHLLWLTPHRGNTTSTFPSHIRNAHPERCPFSVESS